MPCNLFIFLNLRSTNRAPCFSSVFTNEIEIECAFELSIRRLPGPSENVQQTTVGTT